MQGVPQIRHPKQKHLCDTFRILALFLALVLSGGHLFYPRFPLIALMIVLFLLSNPNNFFSLSKKNSVVAVLSVFVLAFASMQPSGLAPIFVRAANFLGALVIFNCYIKLGPERFRKDLNSIIRWFPLQAILTVFLYALAPSIFVPVDETGLRAYVYLLYVHSVGGDGLARPDGFFWEPGILQIFLQINLFFGLWVFKSNLKIIMSVFAIFLTQSSTGVTLLALHGLSYLFYIYRNQSGKKLAIAAAIFPLMIAFLLPMVEANIDQKLFGDLDGSYYARLYDLKAGLLVASEFPLFGVGFDVKSYLAEAQGVTVELNQYAQEVFNERVGNSNGIITLFFTMGFPLGLIFIAGLAFQGLLGPGWSIRVIIIVSLFTEPLTLQPFFIFMSFWGIAALWYSFANGAKVGMFGLERQGASK